MKSHTNMLFIMIVASILPCASVSAQDNTSAEPEPEDTKYSVGFQATFPGYGLSGIMDINENLSIQAILGPFGSLNTYAGRGLYRFQHDEFWNLYGFGMLGLWTYDYFDLDGNDSESSFGFGVGAGIEYNWRAFNEELPPIFWNIELGFGAVNLDFYDFSAILFGFGVHYRF